MTDNDYATPEESAAVIGTRQLTEFEKWLEAELDKIDPHRHDQGHSDYAAMLTLIERIWTAAQPRLTDEEIEDCMKEAYLTIGAARNLEHVFARIIERWVRGEAKP